MINVELDRLEKIVEAYIRQSEREWGSYDGDDQDFGRLQAYKVVLADIKYLKGDE